MTFIPYQLERREYKNLPDSLKSKIDQEDWEKSDEAERETLVIAAGGVPISDRD